MKKLSQKRKLQIFILISALLFIFFACQKERVEPTPPKTLAEIFNSLPIPSPPANSDMTLETVSPGNGPDYLVLRYKETVLGTSSKWWINIISQDFAFGAENWGTVYFAHKYKLAQVSANELLFLPASTPTNEADLRNFQIKIDSGQEFAYLKAEWWTQADIERQWAGLSYIGRIIYFRYSLHNDELVNENLQVIIT